MLTSVVSIWYTPPFIYQSPLFNSQIACFRRMGLTFETSLGIVLLLLK
jgi:hypothetical protein